MASELLGRKNVMISVVKTIMAILVGCCVLFPRLEFCQDIGISVPECNDALVELVAG